MGKNSFFDRIKRTQKWQDYSLAAGMALLLMLVIGMVFDYYYCMNDDTTMRDILSGSYTGTPEERNIQMLYPVSALLSLCYRLFREAPWYGLFLCGCQYFAIFLIGSRVSGLVKRFWVKCAVTFMAVLFAGSILLYELVYVQYTMTSGMLMAAAVFWFYTSDGEMNPAAFLKENIVSIVCVVLAFQIRTEMALLLFPFLLGAGLFKWSKEKKMAAGETLFKYLGIIGAALAFMGISLCLNKLAYGAEEWKKFNLFFDYRTEIYDFLGYPSYEENQEFYEEAGLTKTEAALIDNYNFALDENIDETFLLKMTEYQKEKSGGSALFLTGFDEAAWIYRHSLLSVEYMPYNGLILFVYLLLIIAAVQNKDKMYLWKIPMLLSIRTVCWMYIIFRNRTPERITHGLFLMELMMLFALLAGEWRRKKASRLTVSAIACVIVALSLPAIWEKAYETKTQRAAVNEEWQLLQEYCGKNPDNFYVIDVYSTVAYTEKMYEDVDNSYRNYDLCGGWTAKSPLYEKKLLQSGITNLEKDLREKENVFFVSKANRNIKWLQDYYAEKGIEVEIKTAEEIELNGEVRFVIYRLL